ncbi:MAG: NTP transferase domain-containing protein [Gorillibacterium sp.]|nr:NTP transferase domain-containing protein [Gorillibacterium sp.]
MSIKKAVILAAGRGTRMYPLTRAVPKGLLPVYDQTVLDHIVQEALAAGIEQMIVVIGTNGDMIRRHFQGNNHLTFVEQGTPGGTAHALACARKQVGDDPFALMFGDEVVWSEEPCIGQLASCYASQAQGAITAIEQTDATSIKLYNSLALEATERAELFRIRSFVEKPMGIPPSLYTSIGRHILEPDIFAWIEQSLPLEGEHILADVFARYLMAKPFYGLVYSGRRFDLGNKKLWLEANIEFAAHDPEMKEWMRMYLKSL